MRTQGAKDLTPQMQARIYKDYWEMNYPQTTTTLTAAVFTKQELLEALKDCAENDDGELAHSDADEYLLRFINDEGITKAFEAVKKFYA